MLMHTVQRIGRLEYDTGYFGNLRQLCALSPLSRYAFLSMSCRKHNRFPAVSQPTSTLTLYHSTDSATSDGRIVRNKCVRQSPQPRTHRPAPAPLTTVGNRRIAHQASTNRKMSQPAEPTSKGNEKALGARGVRYSSAVLPRP